jgi:hypothetical protein
VKSPQGFKNLFFESQHRVFSFSHRREEAVMQERMQEPLKAGIGAELGPNYPFWRCMKDAVIYRKNVYWVVEAMEGERERLPFPSQTMLYTFLMARPDIKV